MEYQLTGSSLHRVHSRLRRPEASREPPSTNGRRCCRPDSDTLVLADTVNVTRIRSHLDPRHLLNELLCPSHLPWTPIVPLCPPPHLIHAEIASLPAHPGSTSSSTKHIYTADLPKDLSLALVARPPSIHRLIRLHPPSTPLHRIVPRLASDSDSVSVHPP